MMNALFLDDPHASTEAVYSYILPTPSSSSGLPAFPYTRGFYTDHRYRDESNLAYQRSIHSLRKEKFQNNRNL